MRKLIWVFVTAIVIIAITGVAFLNLTSAVKVTTHIITPSVLSKTVNATGTLKSTETEDITSPIDGIVTAVHVKNYEHVTTDDWIVTVKPDEGEETIVRPASSGIIMTQLNPAVPAELKVDDRVANEQVLYKLAKKKFAVDAFFSETDVSKIDEEDKVFITLDSHPDDEIEGEISLIEHVAQINQLGETVIRVEVELTEELPEPQILGLNADVEVITEEKSGITVPLEAIVSEDGSDIVYIADKDTAVKRNVVLGEIFDEQIEIIAGLSVGDEVITDPVDDISDETRIEKT